MRSYSYNPRHEDKEQSIFGDVMFLIAVSLVIPLGTGLLFLFK